MPVIYEYLGIVISIWSNEHEPIHVHAKYGDSIVKVSLYVKDGRIYSIKYKDETKNFNKAKLRQLKDFITVYKYGILYAWYQLQNNNATLKKNCNY